MAECASLKGDVHGVPSAEPNDCSRRIAVRWSSGAGEAFECRTIAWAVCVALSRSEA